MTFERRIFLETKPVGGTAGMAGHLYLVFRTVETAGGIRINVVQETDLVIRVGPEGNLNVSPMAVQTRQLHRSDDGYGESATSPDGSILVTPDPGGTPQSRHSRDITDLIRSAGVYADAASAWAGMTAFAVGLNGQYRYELPDMFASEHVSNSNASILTVLNNAGVDVRRVENEDGTLYVDSIATFGHPGADKDAPTLLGTNASDLIQASEALFPGVALLGRNTRHDIFIGTPFSDRFYGEQAVDPGFAVNYSATFDTVSYASSLTGLAVRFEAGGNFLSTKPLLIYGVNPDAGMISPLRLVHFES